MILYDRQTRSNALFAKYKELADKQEQIFSVGWKCKCFDMNQVIEVAPDCVEKELR